MLYINAFKNYDEFKELFGIVTHGNGAKSRKNKILLAYYKNPKLIHHFAGEHPVFTPNVLLSVTDMNDLRAMLYYHLTRSFGKSHKLELNNRTMFSNVYSTDGRKGVCEDGDHSMIRYIKHENGQSKPYKMRPGKLLRAIITEHPIGALLSEQVINWMCEEFTAEWVSYAQERIADYTLHVDKDFAAIYDESDRCMGNFHSCMARAGQHSFYNNAVEAHAAYLTDENDYIIARCVIFDEVKDANGNVYRYAERQYSSNGDDLLKHILINKLKAGGHIDIYKTIGAGCGESRSIVDIHGNSMSDCEFHIDCDLDPGDVLSYQDTFKWYDEGDHTAYNVPVGYCESLDITDARYGKSAYDNYHGYFCNDTETVYVNGILYHCDVDRLDDFIWVESQSEYHHEDDVIMCPVCDEYELLNEAYFSDITEEYYCCKDCMYKVEQEFKESNWEWSDYDEDYFEKVANYYEYEDDEFVKKSVSFDSLHQMMDNGEIYEYNDEFYNIRGMTITEALDAMLASVA